MTDDPSVAESAAKVPRRRRWVGLLVVFLVLLALGGGGAAAYWQFVDRKDEDPGVTACRSAGFVVRAARGEVVPDDEVQRVGELFQRSTHEDLKSAGVFAAGAVQRVQNPRASPATADFRQFNLAAAVPRLIAACGNHQVTVKG
ncbi:hypothetical protein TPA0907_13460 [Micromonospora humidisoli]|uniref:LytR cell envelope-related transcriptional attenuator n=1 Tax=Micromonospora humidisoli TaxID=2807622 RepID=A0ABS2JJQ1_9ACTN|nr:MULTISPECIES: hypothetical protein [Micromonospora]MBM7086456.1 hypothetical protein [Micromonospora humidisoli]GHJ06979.1 hypothetical protein TPA0907_13460 [Micromonospora sp. AKA109]